MPQAKVTQQPVPLAQVVATSASPLPAARSLPAEIWLKIFGLDQYEPAFHASQREEEEYKEPKRIIGCAQICRSARQAVLSQLERWTAPIPRERPARLDSTPQQALRLAKDTTLQNTRKQWAEKVQSLRLGGTYFPDGLLPDFCHRAWQTLYSLSSREMKDKCWDISDECFWENGYVDLRHRPYIRALRDFRSEQEIVPTSLSALVGISFLLALNKVGSIAGPDNYDEWPRWKNDAERRKELHFDACSQLVQSPLFWSGDWSNLSQLELYAVDRALWLIHDSAPTVQQAVSVRAMIINRCQIASNRINESVYDWWDGDSNPIDALGLYDELRTLTSPSATEKGSSAEKMLLSWQTMPSELHQLVVSVVAIPFEPGWRDVRDDNGRGLTAAQSIEAIGWHQSLFPATTFDVRRWPHTMRPHFVDSQLVDHWQFLKSLANLDESSSMVEEWRKFVSKENFPWQSSAPPEE